MNVFTISGIGSKYSFGNHYDMSQPIKEDAIKLVFYLSLPLFVSLLLVGWWLRVYRPACLERRCEARFPGRFNFELYRIQWELPQKCKFRNAVKSLIWGALVWCVILILISALGKSLHEVEACKGAAATTAAAAAPTAAAAATTTAAAAAATATAAAAAATTTAAPAATAATTAAAAATTADGGRLLLFYIPRGQGFYHL